jgi:prevent-host-death family protein
MAAYSVADAKNGLPRLIDRALGGEEVIITRHGKPVVELRPTAASASSASAASYAWLKARRDARPPIDMTSVELLRRIYEEPEG